MQRDYPVILAVTMLTGVTVMVNVWVSESGAVVVIFSPLRVP